MQILGGGQQRCPLCQTTLDSIAASGFPKNYSLMQLADQLENTSISTGPGRKKTTRSKPYYASSNFQIFIKTLEGTSMTLDVSPDDSIRVIKSRVHELVGMGF